jgi:Leucine-rich repeat (LRR) protein
MIQPTTEAIVCPEECRCQQEGFNLNCSDSALNIIPSILPTHARTLVLNGNNITYFANRSFVSRGLVDLHLLKADFCELRKIELGAFNGLTKLTFLSVQNNEISEIIPGTFEKISQLEYLNLDHNIIANL